MDNLISRDELCPIINIAMLEEHAIRFNATAKEWKVANSETADSFKFRVNNEMNVETRIALRTRLTNLGYSVVYFCGGSNWTIFVRERKIMRIMLTIAAITLFNIILTFLYLIFNPLKLDLYWLIITFWALLFAGYSGPFVVMILDYFGGENTCLYRERNHI